MSDNTKVITPVGTLSYPHLDKPQKAQKPGDKEKFSATLVFVPGADLKTLQVAALAAAEERWPGKAAEMFAKSILRSPFRKDAEAKGYEAGSVFINCRSEQQPGCVYAHAAPGSTKPEVVPQEKIKEVFYPGAKVRFSVRAFVYDSNGNKGVSFALNNVQKVGEGERLDNRVAAEDEFTADMNAAPADLDSLL